MKRPLVVSRHPAALEFIGRKLDAWIDNFEPNCPACGFDSWYQDQICPVCFEVATGDVSYEDVEDRVVYGNIPLDLAAVAKEVWAIVFPPGKAPRGREYSYRDMVNAGARLVGFVVEEIGVMK